MALAAAPGDVLAVWGGHSRADNMIRVGAALGGLPAVANHVVIVTHQDDLGRWMGIQGRPGGVGLCDCTPHLSHNLTRSNNSQPRPDDKDQLNTFLASAAKSVGVQYDWVGIAIDVAAALHLVNLAESLRHLWRWPADHGMLPGEVVCSSLAAMLYDIPSVGWAHPELGSERECSPSDWWAWSNDQAWAA